jgi:hypothetical protein
MIHLGDGNPQRARGRLPGIRAQGYTRLMVAARFPISIRTILVCALLVCAAGSVSADQPGDPAPNAEPGLFARWRARRLEWIAGTDAWFHAGPLGAYVTLQDTRMSPIIYAGPGAGAALSIDVVRARWLRFHGVAIRYASPTGTNVLPGLYESISGETDGTVLYRFAGTGFAAGGSVRAGMHIRSYDKLQNNMFNSDLTVALNAALRWERPFQVVSRSAAFHVRADLPLVSWINRSPAFAIHGSQAYWAPPTRYLRATVETALTWQLKWNPRNTARVRYVWDFSALDEFDGFQHLRIATHTLVVSVGTRTM